jgi:IS5 family transposase
LQVPALAGRKQLGEQILGQVTLHLQAKWMRITSGTIVDATILHAPASTKNREQQRDPEMHRTKKGNQMVLRDASACGSG